MKTVKDFAEAMKSEEMQEAFNKFIEGKECDTAEKAEKLVKDFALENGFELSEGAVSTLAPEDLSDEALANVAGGLLDNANKPGRNLILCNGQDNRTHLINDSLGIFCRDDNLGLFFNSSENLESSNADAGPRDDHENILW